MMKIGNKSGGVLRLIHFQRVTGASKRRCRVSVGVALRGNRASWGFSGQLNGCWGG